MGSLIWDCVNISTRGDCLRAREIGRQASAAHGFSAEIAGDVDLVITELGSNLVKHAGGGRMLLRCGAETVDILSLDHGPGIRNPGRCLDDHYSTAGTLGGGLGAVRRKSRVFDLYSRRGGGSVMFASVGPEKKRTGPRSPSPAFKYDAVLLRKPGETECGDCWTVHAGAGDLTCLVVDGLGHGPEAARAARRACAAFETDPERPLPELLEAIHGALLDLRGAAGAIARIRPCKHSLSFAGIGNIAGCIVASAASDTRGLPSIQGTLGVVMRRIRTFDFPWNRDSILVMHSDGVSTRWKATDYPGLFDHTPTVIAGAILRDFWRERDDAVVLVVRNVSSLHRR